MQNNNANKHDDFNEPDIDILDSEKDMKYEVMSDEAEIKNPRPPPKAVSLPAPAINNVKPSASDNAFKQT